MTVTRTRFAPSPTGFLHLGGARTALFNWLYARKTKGQFLLRIEDTDLERNTEESAQAIFDSMTWLGLNWDEPPVYQSKRLDLYRSKLDELWRDEKIYPAFESKEELETEKQKAELEKRPYYYDGPSRLFFRSEAARRMLAGENFVWRMRVSKIGETLVPETLMGDNENCRFKNIDIGDFILTRPGTADQFGMPLYNFCNVIDDADQRITHVIRGVEHLSNTAKQVLLYQAFGYTIPSFTHLPLIMKNNRKMSKRDAEADPRFPVSVMGRAEIGYLKEAVLNFVTLLGWSFGGDHELGTIEEIIAGFSLERLIKSNANFDEDKFLHFNSYYMKNLPLPVIVERVKPFLIKAGLTWTQNKEEWLNSVIALEVERCKLLSDFPLAVQYFFERPNEYDPKGVVKLFNPETGKILSDLFSVLENIKDFNPETIERAIKDFADTKVGDGNGLKLVAQPLRLTLTGRTISPSLFDVASLLGKEETLERIKNALKYCQNTAA